MWALKFKIRCTFFQVQHFSETYLFCPWEVTFVGRRCFILVRLKPSFLGMIFGEHSTMGGVGKSGCLLVELDWLREFWKPYLRRVTWAWCPVIKLCIKAKSSLGYVIIFISPHASGKPLRTVETPCSKYLVFIWLLLKSCLLSSWRATAHSRLL